MTPIGTRLLSPTAAALLVCSSILAGITVVPEADADLLDVPHSLPAGRRATSVVWTGDYAYVFGGWSSTGYHSDILRYNPADGTVTTMGAALPTARWGTSAVWTGSAVYIFGGCLTGNCDTATTEILKYIPATDTLTTLTTASFPSVRCCTSAVWTGSVAYVFGGYVNGNLFLNDILKFDPTTETMSNTGHTLPTARWGTSAIWDGTSAYIFGGWTGAATRVADIVKYNPTAGTASVVASFPSQRGWTSAVWDGDAAYVFGGFASSPYLDQIMKFVPSTNAVTQMPAVLPSGRYTTSAFLSSDRAYVLGGWDGSSYISQIVRYNPYSPGPVADLQAEAGPSLGEITLTWSAPANPGKSAVTSYKVYRSTTLTGTYNLIEGSTNSPFTDDGLSAATTFHYRVSAVNSYGAGPMSNIASGTTFSSGTGTMVIRGHPVCSTAGDSGDVSYCNSPRYGYDSAINSANIAAPQFEIQWGDFDGHENVVCPGGPCQFWMEFDLQVLSPSADYSGYNGQSLDVAQLERWDPETLAWQSVNGGLIRGGIVSPDGANPWGMHLPARLHIPATDLATHQDETQFRLRMLARPGTSQPWSAYVTAAQAQLVAPPIVFVHGWDFDVDKSSYFGTASWASSMESGLFARSYYVYGQNPWAWSDHEALLNLAVDAKADFRISAFNIYDGILELRDNPMGETNDDFAYVGPVNLVAHSLGGLMSRYLIEVLLPALEISHGGTIVNQNQQTIWDLANERNRGPQYAPEELVAGLVTMGTPHLGSGWAEHFVVGNDKRLVTATCVGDFDCEHYYLDRDGDELMDHSNWGFGSTDIRSWWRDDVRAYRNWRHYDDDAHISVMADLELLKISKGNPPLENLHGWFASQPIKYFMIAGDANDDLGEGDVIVSIKSATHDRDDKGCYQIYNDVEANYGGTTYQPLGDAWHNGLPIASRVHNDALVFMAGNKYDVCANDPAYPDDASSAMSSSSLTEAETSYGSEQYSAPVNATLSQTNGTWSASMTWNAPGGTNGTIQVDAAPSLGNATLEIRSPTGELAAFVDGNSTAVRWNQPVDLQAIETLNIETENATAGLWTLWINGTSSSTSLATRTLFEIESPIRGVSPTTALVGDATSFVVNAVANATVSLLFENPTTGSVTSVALSDGGAAPDLAADDGNYTASYTFTTGGHVAIQVNVALDNTTFEWAGGVAVLIADGEGDRTCAQLLPDLAPDVVSSLLALNPSFVVDCSATGDPMEIADGVTQRLAGAVEGEPPALALPDPPALPDLPALPLAPAVHVVPANAVRADAMSTVSPTATGFYDFEIARFDESGQPVPIVDWRIELHGSSGTGPPSADNAPFYSIGSYGALTDVAAQGAGGNQLTVRLPASRVAPAGASVAYVEIQFPTIGASGETSSLYSEQVNALIAEGRYDDAAHAAPHTRTVVKFTVPGAPPANGSVGGILGQIPH